MSAVVCPLDALGIAEEALVALVEHEDECTCAYQDAPESCPVCKGRLAIEIVRSSLSRPWTIRP